MKVKNSEFLNCLGFFLLFVISTYSLIPNDRVITDDPNDFDLLEGITYNIIHSISEKNLVSVVNNIQIGISNNSNPYQHWSLRKVEGKNNVYNIINIGSRTNLDNNGKKVYVSSYEHNSNVNPYQHWIFMKIKNNTYNIANVRNESRSLDGSIDSNGELVYISISNKDNLYQQWLFEPTNYKLITKVMDFNLNFDQILISNKTPIIRDNRIENPTKATIEQTIDRTETKSNIFTLQIRKSESFEVGEHVDMSFEIDRNVFNKLNVKLESLSIEGNFSSTDEKTNRKIISDIVSYHIKHKVIVPPHTSIQVNVIIYMVNLVVPFTAKIHVIAKADRLNKSGKVDKMVNVDGNATLYYLQRESTKDVFVDENIYYINTNGTLEVDGYGFDSIKTKTISQESQESKPQESQESEPQESQESEPKESQKSESTSKKPVILYQILLIILQFHFFINCKLSIFM
ncbi:hypothetical protein RhiirA5_381948 [Rhizophagus irregularis]|uniref:Ricin B lectin domain-containing protein n=1 Tax=Rhizophagus irregularis TaxID=588596 RepID=A0A2N0P2X9_9GLOM|nr:hypothetical protein RhiirA5_381948 [Rhizophagus irregularis]PKC74586.1 hypothetical protein RhiirA1_512240 [Rhizophagus irregularis]CAB4488722.1 unnamed protein product [Rhizophagus irregularis]CAB5214514.1 unnamed protein product [Rhizophagus irregularis]CAB5384045.1 unnamed protein product [Rhizophagus irregularis]